MYLYNWLTYFHLLFYTLMVIFGWRSFLNAKLPTKVFTVVFSLLYFVQLLSLVFAKLAINNLLFFHLMLLIQFIGYNLFYWLILPANKTKSFALGLMFFSMAIILVEYYLNWEKLYNVYGGYGYFALNISFVFFSIYYLVHDILNDLALDFRYLNYAMLIYSGGSSIIFLLGDKLGNLGIGGQVPILIINIVLHLLYQVFYAIEIWKIRR
ncbi:hypothetical protein KZP23_16840 [Echinicola marina]|uniref:hypothetical protein n=1 Tax=Echinicola marina TaxID=2859768 RepID=UPI001CF63E46|nr:hypothetical protein [Echinicola marina]UCS92356.1 hypothetical protein KZP23_16840 [Echinicola marina]